MIKYGYQINSWFLLSMKLSPKLFWETVLRDVSENGFEGLELMQVKTPKFKVPTGKEDILSTFGSKRKFLEILDGNELKICGEFFYLDNNGPLKFYDSKQYERIVEAADREAKWLQEIGGEFLVVGTNWRVEIQNITLKHLKIMAKCFNGIGKTVLDYGIKAGIHPHHGGTIDTRKEIDIIMKLTNPDYFYLVPDTAQHYLTGVGYYDIIREYSDRIGYIHLKDAKKVYGLESITQAEHISKRYYWELGEGKVDFEAVTKLLKDINYDGWLTVECDGAKNPSESVKINKKFIEKNIKPTLQ